MPTSLVADPQRGDGLVRLFLWWRFAKALSFRGYWLVTAIYLVVVADLSPFELVFLGTAMELTVFVSEIPTGVVADTISRKWSLVISHVLMGAGMLTTGLVTDFVPLVLAQMLWGLGWTFSSGADIAWITDELDDATRIDRVLTVTARYLQYGAIVGMVGMGVFAWATSMATAIVCSGAVMAALGVLVAARFPEHNFTPTRDDRWRTSMAIFRRGASLARRDHQIMLVLTVTVLINAGAEAFDRLQAKRLIDLGFPEQPDPILWFTVLGVSLLFVGAGALRIVEMRIDDEGVPRITLLVSTVVAVIGLLLLGHAPSVEAGIAGVVLVGGVAWTLIHSVSAIWVNRRTTSDVRATVHSFLGQTESVGEISGGIVMAVLAQSASITVALTASAALIAVSAVVIARSRAGRATGGDHRAVRATGGVA
jgi:MFS family permease